MHRFISRELEQKIGNKEPQETINVVISLEPEYHGRSQETADEIIDDYDINNYDKIISPSGGKMYIYCEATIDSLEQIEQTRISKDKQEHRIKRIFIPRR